MRTTLSTRRLRLGALLAVATAGAAVFGALGNAAPTQPSAQAVAPANTAPPTISDTTPQTGQTLTASPGTWRGDQPIVFTYQWLRCNAGGRNCVPIPTANTRTYTVQSADAGNTLRVRVTATNADGSSTAQSEATSRVTAAGPPATGAVPIAAVTPPNRLAITQVVFNPNPISLQTRAIDVRVHVREQSGRPVSGALVFVRSTPLVTSSAGEVATGNDGTATVRLIPRSNYGIIRFQDNLQVFVRARKSGENLQAGVSSRRLVQVRIAN
jgi:hypothetical protein